MNRQFIQSIFYCEPSTSQLFKKTEKFLYTEDGNSYGSAITSTMNRLSSLTLLFNDNPIKSDLQLVNTINLLTKKRDLLIERLSAGLPYKEIREEKDGLIIMGTSTRIAVA